MDLIKKIVSLNRALSKSKIPYAFGGALALAWCTQRARGTIDIDVNLFVDQHAFEEALAALPKNILYSPKEKTALKRDGQVRLWWEQTPVDLFLNTTPLHSEIQTRIQFEEFAGVRMPFLACQDIAIFKVFFNRSKDWADIEEMLHAKTIKLGNIKTALLSYLEKDDARIQKLDELISNYS